MDVSIVVKGLQSTRGPKDTVAAPKFRLIKNGAIGTKTFGKNREFNYEQAHRCFLKCVTELHTNDWEKFHLKTPRTTG